MKSLNWKSNASDFLLTKRPPFQRNLRHGFLRSPTRGATKTVVVNEVEERVPIPSRQRSPPPKLSRILLRKLPAIFERTQPGLVHRRLLVKLAIIMTSHIDSQTPMSDLLEVFPGAQRALFARYHIGGCASCGFRPDETLGDVCARNENLPVDEVIAHIEASHAKEMERQLSPEDLKAHLESDEKPALLDLRTREEHENVKIEGTEMFTHDKLQEIMGRWPKDRAIVIYDHLGENSCMDAAAYLEGHGFTNVRTLQGGIDAYSQKIDRSLTRYRIEIADN